LGDPVLDSLAVPLDLTITRWLLDPATRNLRIEAAFTRLVAILAEHGLPLARIRLTLPTLHPEIYVRTLTWTRERGALLQLPLHEITYKLVYRDSPVAAIHAGAGPIRCRLKGPDADLRYPICRELAEKGLTDYLCAPLELSGGRRTYVSVSTAAAHGFDDAALAAFIGVLPQLALWIELKSAQDGARALLEVYLGKNAAERVLAGEVRRGTGATVHAAIWTCDLRGFTAMSDALPAAEVVRTLDGYFEAVAGPIGDLGGEVLKFIGDAVLAIFPVADGDRRAACRLALQAAERAVDAMDELNRARAGAGEPRLELGLAVHVGEVMYGNIGARERLDFTVIGAAVNEACRMESLCKALKTPLLVSAACAGSLADPRLVSLGEHALRGVAEPLSLFTLPAYAQRTAG
jgi:adenylate cyclase